MTFSYWGECVSEAFDEAGITASAEQIALVVQHVEGAHECRGMHSYQLENPLIAERARLEKALKAEREKVGCSHCGGSGRERYNAGSWGVDTQCWVCHGEGKVKP